MVFVRCGFTSGEGEEWGGKLVVHLVQLCVKCKQGSGGNFWKAVEILHYLTRVLL